MKMPLLSVVAAGAAMIAASGPLAAQGPSPASTVKPRPAPTLPVRSDSATAARPKLQTPADTAKAMTQADRLAIQSDLAWTSHYNGAINGEVGERMIAAIKTFQKDHGGKETGVLNPQERGALAEAAKKAQHNVGWKVITEMTTGARIGLPAKLVPNTAADQNGSRWSSPTGMIQITFTKRKDAGTTTTAAVAEHERKVAARKIEYSAVKPDFFVLSGTQNLKKFYIRGQIGNSEARILTILYDQATEGTMVPVTVAMSSAFNPFPSSKDFPPPRSKVEYSSGIVVSPDGVILADRHAIDGCATITIAGFGNADQIAQDELHDLALLRLYGVQGLPSLAIGDAAPAKSSVTITGIADPQMQNGGHAVSSIAATAGQTAENTLSPAPASGFSGAAVTDSDGKFLGAAHLRPAQVAGPAAPAGQASYVSASTVRDFLRANKITPSSTGADAKAALVRVICVRK
ncbi:MAG: trypsin-like peptidase domain-containing protein [Rhizobiales bacterium]|nr:trypsin-like peptidase domain-containing protein [Hyphomicrobiales bacterium]